MLSFRLFISHMPGKDLIMADALSRASAATPTRADEDLQEETKTFINIVLQCIPATEKRLEAIKDL